MKIKDVPMVHNHGIKIIVSHSTHESEYDCESIREIEEIEILSNHYFFDPKTFRLRIWL